MLSIYDLLGRGQLALLEYSPGAKEKDHSFAPTSFLNTSFFGPIQGPEPPNSWLLLGPGAQRFRVSISVRARHPLADAVTVELIKYMCGLIQTSK